MESWTLFQAFIPGATDVEGEGAWKDLDALVKRKLRFPGGREYAPDQGCVDAGYNTAASEQFCRGYANRLPVFGRAGWHLPILGRGQAIRYERQGRKSGQAAKRPDDKAYLVGTFGVKQAWYGYLGASLAAAKEEAAARLAPR